jgi:hypothetical protein
MRRSHKVVVSALGGALVVVACAVPDVELVDRLPGGGRAGASGAATSGTGANNGEGGDPAPSGGDGSYGGDEQGGSAGTAGSVGTAGSAGRAGSGGSGGGSAGSAGSAGMGIPFPDTSVCDSGGEGIAWCEPFESDSPVNLWGPPIETVLPCEDDECPSPPGYLQLTEELGLDLTLNLELGAKLSFWARIDKLTDEVFVSFYINGDPRPVKFGVEGDHYRWRFGVVAAERSAPSSPQNSPAATIGTWACIELVRSESELRARVVPFGKPAVQLPVVDFEATEGEDDTWVPFYPAQTFDFTGEFSFGQEGSSTVFIDEIAIGTVDSLSTCDHYLQSQ